MKFASVSKRLATVGVATALVGGAVVGTTATSADAATASTDYTCAVPLLGDQTFPVTVTSAVLDLTSSLPAGMTFPEGLLDTLGGGHAVEMAITAPAQVVQTLAGLGTLTGVSSPDLAMVFGSSQVPVSGLALTGAPTVNPDGSAVFNTAGTNGTFKTPAAGEYDITLPQAFTFVASTTSTDFPSIPIACTSAAPAVLKHMTVTKNSSATTAKAVSAKVKKGKHAVLNTVVKASNVTPTGKLVAMDGSKKVGAGTLTAGKAKLKLATMSVGVHKIVVKYLGDGYAAASKSNVVKIRVVK